MIINELMNINNTSLHCTFLKLSSELRGSSRLTVMTQTVLIFNVSLPAMPAMSPPCPRPLMRRCTAQNDRNCGDKARLIIQWLCRMVDC